MNVVIQKPDMDTCLTALILGVRPGDSIAFATAGALQADLVNPNVICIEAGGSGRVDFKNFDHHDPFVYYPPACLQAYVYIGCDAEGIGRLVDYVSEVDEGKHHRLPIEPPSLSSVFSGMLLVEKSRLSRLHTGMLMLRTVLDRSIDPFQTSPNLPEWRDYLVAKERNRRKLAQDMISMLAFRTAGGLSGGFLETDAVGAPGAILTTGCDLAIACSHGFGVLHGLKVTISGPESVLPLLKKAFDRVEAGWGGRSGILSSPWPGTRLSKAQVIQIISEAT